MGNKRPFKEISSDSLIELYLHSISGGSGEHKLYSSDGFADDELNHPSSEVKNTTVPKVCYRCNTVLDTISRCCRICYQTRQEWMPSRPTKKLRKREFSLVSSDEEKSIPMPPLSKYSNLQRLQLAREDKEDFTSSDENTVTNFAVERRRERLKRREYIKNIIDKAYEDTSESSTGYESICMVCRIRPLEAVLVHEKTAHLCVCKKCAVILDHNKGRCPVCEKKSYYYFTGCSHNNKSK